jgi:hypothetical protein
MPTYIDESGDTGVHPHSTQHFRLAAVWFETVATADEFERRSVDLRARLNLRADFEFHFTHLTEQLRRTFWSSPSPSHSNTPTSRRRKGGRANRCRKMC